MNFSAPLEHWITDAGSDTVAVLNIPGLVGRHRVFDIDVTLVVNVPGDRSDSDRAEDWHELAVEFDGSLEWSRRVPSHNPGGTDGLDYHQRVRLDPDQDLRVRALVKTSGARVRQLRVEAKEEG